MRGPSTLFATENLCSNLGQIPWLWSFEMRGPELVLFEKIVDGLYQELAVTVQGSWFMLQWFDFDLRLVLAQATAEAANRTWLALLR